MDKPKLLLIMYRAIGDALYTAPVFPYLLEKYDVYVDCSFKVYQLLHDDPRFKKVARFIFEIFKKEELPAKFLERWQMLREQIKPDVEINMNGTIEVVCIGERFQEEFHRPVGERRVLFGSNSFYQSVFGRAGMEVPNPLNTEGLYFSPEQTQTVEAWAKRNEGKFVVMMPFSGSTAQKRFENVLELTDQILAKYPEAVVYLAGEHEMDAKVPKHPRIKSLCGDRAAIKQIVQMTKYASVVVGPETFLLVAAGMWGTPKIILATASSVYQMTAFQRNDYSFQAPIWCSPCHRAIYEPTDCESMLYDEQGKAMYPACTTKFPVGPIMERVDKIYSLWKEKVYEPA